MSSCLQPLRREDQLQNLVKTVYVNSLRKKNLYYWGKISKPSLYWYHWLYVRHLCSYNSVSETQTLHYFLSFTSSTLITPLHALYSPDNLIHWRKILSITHDPLSNCSVFLRSPWHLSTLLVTLLILLLLSDGFILEEVVTWFLGNYTTDK